MWLELNVYRIAVYSIPCTQNLSDASTIPDGPHTTGQSGPVHFPHQLLVPSQGCAIYCHPRNSGCHAPDGLDELDQVFGFVQKVQNFICNGAVFLFCVAPDIIDFTGSPLCRTRSMAEQ